MLKKELSEKNKLIIIAVFVLLILIFTFLAFFLRKESRSENILPVEVVIVNRLECGEECYDYFELARNLNQKYQDNDSVVLNYYNTNESQSYFNAYSAAIAAEQQSRFWEYLEKIYQGEGPFSDNDLIVIAEELQMDIDKFNQDRESQTIVEKNTSQIDASGEYANGNMLFILIEGELFIENDIVSVSTKIDSYL